MFIFAIVAGYKPSMIEEEYNKIKDPISRHFAEKDAEAMRLAKEHAWDAWSKKIKLPADCTNPSAMRELECKNQWQVQVDTFERIWNENISKGWRPDGI